MWRFFAPTDHENPDGDRVDQIAMTTTLFQGDVMPGALERPLEICRTAGLGEGVKRVRSKDTGVIGMTSVGALGPKVMARRVERFSSR